MSVPRERFGDTGAKLCLRLLQRRFSRALCRMHSSADEHYLAGGDCTMIGAIAIGFYELEAIGWPTRGLAQFLDLRRVNNGGTIAHEAKFG